MKTQLNQKRDSLLNLILTRPSRTNDLYTYIMRNTPPVIKVIQQETGFFIKIEMEKLEDILRITQFQLHDVSQLEHLSKNLYDASLIDIILQALKYLYTFAKQQELSEILFILPEEEAAKILCFEGLFEDCSPIKLGREQRVSLTLSCFLDGLFFRQIGSLQTKIQHELWKAQREDLYLRNYLQHHQKGVKLTFPAIKRRQENNNILLFPSKLASR